MDEDCATNLPGIYAAGDVANAWHPLPGERLWVEHEPTAQNQGGTADRNMLGRCTPYLPVPCVWSDQYDLELRSIGHAGPEDTVVPRGHPESRSFLACYLRGTELPAALGVNRAEEINAVRQLIHDRATATAEHLADEGVNLAALAATAT